MVEFSITIIDMIEVVGITILSFFTYKGQRDRVRLESIEIRISSMEDSTVTLKEITDLINPLITNLTTIDLNQNSQSSKKTLTKFNINSILTDALITKDRMSLEELKTMAFILNLNGKNGIDYMTQRSASRTILQAMSRRGGIEEIARYIEENRPDIFESYEYQ